MMINLLGKKPNKFIGGKMGDRITMSEKELNRLRPIHQALSGQISQITASRILGLSYRQTKRILKRVKQQGDKGIIHRNRGKPSKRKIPDQMESQIISIYTEKYPDFGPTLANEKLKTVHGIKISTEKLRQLLIKHGLWIVGKKKLRKIHVWRERKHHFGEMIQIDGSHHRWLEDRYDGNICLMGYIDDATGEVFGRFYEYEGVVPAFDSFIMFSKRYGFPESVYVDRHSTYKTTRSSTIKQQLKNEKPKSQFEKVMQKIGVQTIHARSPQAKGRVERLFGTFQDRLVKEMRLAGICSIYEANMFLNKYLPEYNSRFTVRSKSPVSMIRRVPSDFDYKWTFSIDNPRRAARDYTIRYNNRVFVVKNPYHDLKRENVIIQEALDGDIRIIAKRGVLTFEEIVAGKIKPAI